MWPISLQEKKLRPKVFVRKWRALMRIRVLLVDDEEQFVDLLSQRLKARNFEVLTALGGDEGLSVLDKVDIDVAVLDVMMPGRDGLSMLQEFKRTRPLTEVIMLTGNTTVETAISGMKLGAFDYLLKPVDMSILIDKLTSASQRKKEHEDRIRNAEVERIVKTKGY
jgi:DNA-binding response OmpR family regulator